MIPQPFQPLPSLTPDPESDEMPLRLELIVLYGTIAVLALLMASLVVYSLLRPPARSPSAGPAAELRPRTGGTTPPRVPLHPDPEQVQRQLGRSPSKEGGAL